MKFFIVSGSHRKNSESARVANFILGRFPKVLPKHETFYLNLGENPIPLWDESVWEGAELWKKIWTPYADQLKESSALVVVSPDWGGMVPAALKNFFLLCNSGTVGHKPALITTVSSSRGGSYPVAELRMSSYKNNRVCYIPEHIIVRDSEKMLLGAEAAGEDDRYLRERIDKALVLLHEYAKALTLVRESKVWDFKLHPNGM